MKNLKLLNKKFFSVILLFTIFGLATESQEPLDIWKLEQKTTVENIYKSENLKENNVPENSIFQMQSEKSESLSIKLENELTSKETKLIGLYDPAKNGLRIDMWNNSNGDQIMSILKRINKISLSKDASEILNILLLTNSYYPKKNITDEQFLEIKSNWLMKNSNIKLIEKYLLDNQIVNENAELAKYLVDHYLSLSELDKSCEIFSKIEEVIEDDYLSKFKIYCLINDNKSEEAQLLLDLKRELGFKDNFYEKKINYLIGYTEKIDTTISQKTILDFHLSHKVNPNFKFEPNNSTSKKIWKYLSSSNLLGNSEDINLEDLDKIKTIEKATHDQNYNEKELFALYKRFQFNINQLLNIKHSSKSLSNIQTRALIYQGILITSENEKKIRVNECFKKFF